MTVNGIFERGIKFPKNFFYGDLSNIEKIYELSEGLFVIAKDEGENVLFWGVNELEDLKSGLKVIEKENNNFRFTYAGNLNDVLDTTKIISEWGNPVKNTHVGYFLDMKDTDLSVSDKNNIEELELSEIERMLQFERSVFDSFNVSEEELNDWVKSDDYIILVYKINEEIKGFTMMNIYGDEKDQCFVRNLGVAKDQRRKGIGEKLILSGLQMAQNRGVKKSMLWVGLNNTGARSLYDKIGYKLNENEAEVVFNSK